MIDYDSLPFHDILNTWHSEDNSGCGLLERSEPMISVAVETKTEFDANRKVIIIYIMPLCTMHVLY